MLQAWENNAGTSYVIIYWFALICVLTYTHNAPLHYIRLILSQSIRATNEISGCFIYLYITFYPTASLLGPTQLQISFLRHPRTTVHQHHLLKLHLIDVIEQWLVITGCCPPTSRRCRLHHAGGNEHDQNHKQRHFRSQTVLVQTGCYCYHLSVVGWMDGAPSL